MYRVMSWMYLATIAGESSPEVRVFNRPMATGLPAANMTFLSSQRESLLRPALPPEILCYPNAMAPEMGISMLPSPGVTTCSDKSFHIVVTDHCGLLTSR
jgi:hypothetical protein